MDDFTRNVIQINQDGSTNVVLGAIVHDTVAKLSKRMRVQDQLAIISLAETYSAPSIIEFLGRHVTSVAHSGLKVAKNERTKRLLGLYERVGIALLASSIAIDTLARSVEDGAEAEEKTSALPTTEEFLARVKRLQKDLSKLDREKGKAK